MREPDFDIDGWCLDDGEQIHSEAPKTFWIPARKEREGLSIGDYAKLVFRISVEKLDEPVAVERMWVVVRERIPGGYLGVLDNEPDAIEENKEFWRGVELPFEARHVINILPGDAASAALASQPPMRRWSES